MGAFGPRPGFLDEAVCGRAGPKGLDRQRRVPDASPRPTVAAAFEFYAIAHDVGTRCGRRSSAEAQRDRRQLKNRERVDGQDAIARRRVEQALGHLGRP
jgi:hypothetical protein